MQDDMDKDEWIHQRQEKVRENQTRKDANETAVSKKKRVNSEHITSPAKWKEILLLMLHYTAEYGTAVTMKIHR